MTDNPLLKALRVPGETFPLPSKGMFYKDGELDPSVKDGEVHVRPLTAVHELIMKSPDKLFSGKAVHEVFADCIPEVLKPGELLVKDVDYLMMCLRAVSYGDELSITLKHDCKDAKENKYNLNVRQLIRAAKPIDPTSLTKTFALELTNGQVLTLRPPTFDDTMAIYQSLDNSSQMTQDYDEREIALRLVKSLASMIIEVDGTSDKEMILEWLQQLRAGWVNDIADKIQDVSNWGIQQTTSVKCKDCDANMDVEVPTNPITFFT